MALAEIVRHGLIEVVRKPASSSKNGVFTLNPRDFVEMGDIMTALGYQVTRRQYNWRERLAMWFRLNHQHRSLEASQVFESIDEFLR